MSNDDKMVVSNKMRDVVDQPLSSNNGKSPDVIMGRKSVALRLPFIGVPVMKPILIFTEYKEDHGEFATSMEMSCSVNGNICTAHSGDFSTAKATDQLMDIKFVNLLDQLTREVMDALIKSGAPMMDPREMVLVDRLSLFEIKQTVEFNNQLNGHFRDTSIITKAIW